MAYLHGEQRRDYVGRMFSRIAGRYDLMNSVMTLGRHHAWRRKVAALAARGVEGPALDVAAGTGDLTMALLRHANITAAVGLDLLPIMLQLARKKSQAGRVRRAHFVAGDALQLPFKDNTFACATCAFGLRNMPDVRDSLAEMARVLRPGGRLVTLEIVPLDPQRRLAPILRFYLHRVVPWLGSRIAGDREAYAYLPQSADRFPTAERLAAMMEEVGLRCVAHSHAGLGTVAMHCAAKPD